MANVYETRKDADGFLYIIYTDESTYGADEWDPRSIRILLNWIILKLSLFNSLSFVLLEYHVT